MLKSIIIRLTTFFCLFFIILGNSTGNQCQAQDVQFSQFYSAPVYLNPSMIGFSEAPRISINFRDQLAGFDGSFVTGAISYDQHFHAMRSSLGLNLVMDRAGGLMNTLHLTGVYAYHMPMGENFNVKAGFNFGVIQQSLNATEFVFADMINPNAVADNIAFPTSEAPLENINQTKFDVGAGFLLYNETFYAGASFKHLTQPEFIYSSNSDDGNKLSILSSIHVGKTFYLNDPFFEKDRWYVVPNALFAHQFNFIQVNVGTYVGHGPIFGGLWLRHTIQNSDALIGLIGFKKGIFKIAYSYDADLGKVKTSAGAHEISLTFDMGKSEYNKRKVRIREQIYCPTMFQ